MKLGARVIREDGIGPGALSASLLVLALLAAVLVIWVGWRASIPLEINANEAWNAWHTDDAFRFDRLYPPRNLLTVNNYPPLSFIVLRLLSPLFPNAIVAGRALSLLSILATAAASYACARELGAERKSSALGALWFIATIVRVHSDYAGMNDPNLFGLAVAAGAFYVFLSARTTNAIYLAVFLMAAAGFIKPNLVAIPTTALAYLALTRPRLAARAAIFGAAACAMFAALSVAAYGWNFIDDMLTPRLFQWERPLRSLGHLRWVALVWPFWIVWLRSSENVRAKKITVIFVVAAAATWAFFKLGAGVNENAQFELAFATSLCVSATVGALGERRISSKLGSIALSTIFCLVLLARLLISDERDPYLLLVSPSYRSVVAERSEILQREVERVRAMPGPVACSIRTVCYLAGKALDFDQFSVEQQLATGRATQAQIVAAESGIRFETIDPRAQWDAP